MSGRYRLAVVFILGDGNSTLTGNGENSVLKTPGSVVTGNLIALFGCCAAGRINGIKVYRICVRGIINNFGIFNYWLAWCCLFRLQKGNAVYWKKDCHHLHIFRFPDPHILPRKS